MFRLKEKKVRPQLTTGCSPKYKSKMANTCSSPIYKLELFPSSGIISQNKQKIDFAFILHARKEREIVRIPHIMVIYYLVFSMFIDLEVDNIERDALVVQLGLSFMVFLFLTAVNWYQGSELVSDRFDWNYTATFSKLLNGIDTITSPKQISQLIFYLLC